MKEVDRVRKKDSGMLTLGTEAKGGVDAYKSFCKGINLGYLKK